ncbi:MAG: hypothetical protein ABL866_16080 [Devosia sp.]
MDVTIAMVVGYALNAIGTVLMIRYGLPYSLPLLGLIRKAFTEKEATEDDKRHLFGAFGLVMMALGTMLLIVTALLK